MISKRILLTPAVLFSFCVAAHAQSFGPTAAFPLTQTGLVISRPVQLPQPFTVAGEHGVLVGTQDGSFESWILPVKLLSHLTIEANLEGYTVPIQVNPQAANIEVRPDHTTITYSHPGFTLRQIMFSPNSCQSLSERAGGLTPVKESREPMRALAPEGCSSSSLNPHTGPIVLFQIDAVRPLDLTFRFTPEMRWMWPKRNEGIPSPEWVPAKPQATGEAEPAQSTGEGFYILHLDYGDLAGAVTIPTATPGILAPYQERPQVHPLELHLHYDPKRDGTGPQAKYFPLLMAVATTTQSATAAALRQSLNQLNISIPAAYQAHAAQYARLESESTSIQTPDKSLNEAFQWGVVSIEQLKAQEYITGEKALVAGYYASEDSARPGFGWFFGRDALYTLYAVNSFGDFALTRSELEFLVSRQRPDGKIMHEFSQTASDSSVDWKSFPYMYAAADATPLFLMAMRDYLRASGDLAFLQAHQEAIEKAWSFETAPTSDTDHDGIYDNSQGTGWVESWPNNTMPHQEVYLALLDKQASLAYSAIEDALSDLPGGPAANPRAQALAEIEPAHRAELAYDRAEAIKTTIEKEYYDPQKGCYAFSHNLPGDPNGETDNSTTVYPAIAWWDDESLSMPEIPRGSDWRRRRAAEASSLSGEKANHPGNQSGLARGRDRADTASEVHGALAPDGSQPLAHPEACLQQFAAPTLDTDWGLRDVATTEPFYDGLSYHQGSVWPLFTGWAALAEYRANQSLAGEQMLMQNVDLTWAQDPGSVTELLSGDFFVPFGRSTSHQLWSSAMVITPTLRGLFGISLDAATNTITVNPHLPATWNHAEIKDLRFGNQVVGLTFSRNRGILSVDAHADKAIPGGTPLTLRSDLPGARLSKGTRKEYPLLDIPLPPLELALSEHQLPSSGSRANQPKILSAHYAPGKLTTTISGPANSTVRLAFQKNGKLPNLNVAKDFASKNPGSKANISARITLDRPPDPKHDGPESVEIDFGPGNGWQTVELTLTW
jgi:glycogen debranching enzyme